MSPRWTKSELTAFNERQNPTDPESESALHAQIMDWCNRQWPKWQYVHSRFGIKTTQAAGVPDLIIAAPLGRTYWVECKTKKGKESTEQLAWRLGLEQMGHTAVVIRSYQEFLDLVQLKTEPNHVRD